MLSPSVISWNTMDLILEAVIITRSELGKFDCTLCQFDTELPWKMIDHFKKEHSLDVERPAAGVSQGGLICSTELSKFNLKINPGLKLIICSICNRGVCSDEVRSHVKGHGFSAGIVCLFFGYSTEYKGIYRFSSQWIKSGHVSQLSS